MGHSDGFYTMKGYALNADGEMTSAMEDYLEMIFRLAQQNQVVRVSDLSRMLHVKASSVTKMVQQLGLSDFCWGKNTEIFFSRTRDGRSATICFTATR